MNGGNTEPSGFVSILADRSATTKQLESFMFLRPLARGVLALDNYPAVSGEYPSARPRVPTFLRLHCCVSTVTNLQPILRSVAHGRQQVRYDLRQSPPQAASPTRVATPMIGRWDHACRSHHTGVEQSFLESRCQLGHLGHLGHRDLRSTIKIGLRVGTSGNRKCPRRCFGSARRHQAVARVNAATHSARLGLSRFRLKLPYAYPDPWR